ncbi:asparaginase domain-containing protein [Halomonas sp. McH1-25]|uniref:asparaginase domain-containing protein n=1 Tax=unclassified Halomonas TaxID=2609666 RepID=UPI001EF3FA69|nr:MULTISPECIES: asparaginase domain-containing protein [unclassified Halomonas]MCG7601552.1 asparaginase domain-containing protein [Halomonas sp. McH1-25]MCP1343350.1 asparaginase domain-containing protein [Halomonas sp. FL8]MCP1362619.1 asparaginase domain-containing protein [Halomonas sp. BBD45]MCP1365117.1 asparaginase domain-containing protein [Halomonas sp. BBD48]
MTRVLVLHTGGTIGMQASAHGYVPAQDFAERLATHLVADARRSLPDYDLEELHPLIDSADLAPNDWNRLVARLAVHWPAYDGFIVLHGTDTMAYTASALSFMLGALDKPVLLTGAQIPLGEPRSDALDNLVTALQMAVHPDVPREVGIVFHQRLLRGNRARKVHSQGMAAFDSPNAPWLGEAGIQLRFTSRGLPAGAAPDFTPVGFIADAVALFTVHPGLSATLLDNVLEHAGLKALVLSTYGAGNPPGLEGRLVPALHEASRRGVAIFNLTQCLQGHVIQGTYATGGALTAAGVTGGQDMTPEAAISKLHVLLGRGVTGEALKVAFLCPDRGDITPG